MDFEISSTFQFWKIKEIASTRIAKIYENLFVKDFVLSKKDFLYNLNEFGYRRNWYKSQ